MKILQDVKTYENLRTLIVEVEAVQLGLSGSVDSLEELLKESAPKHAPTILKYLRLINAIDNNKAEEELVALEKDLRKVKEVELTMSFIPSEEFIDEVFGWVVENVSNEVVLRFKRDPSVVAGALITYEGKYLDYSSAKRIKEALEVMRKAKQ